MDRSEPDGPSEAPRLILASASPRRRELMGLMGLPFEVRVSTYDEPAPPDTPIPLAGFVTELAVGKGRAVAEHAGPNCLVIGADTIVTLDQGEIGLPVGKPIDAEDARRMLGLLSGAVHVVYTGVALLKTGLAGDIELPLCNVTRTKVTFRELNDAMVSGYLRTGEPYDKAGAYGAQGYAAPFIERIEGDYFNVVGLPLSAVGRLLESAGVPWWQHRTILPPVVG